MIPETCVPFLHDSIGVAAARGHRERRSECDDGIGDESTDRPAVGRPGRGVDRGRGVATDGGRRFVSLRAAERDVLYVIRELEREGDAPKGTEIKDRLDERYGEELGRSRLYRNLGDLVDAGLVTKGVKDARTNEYATTRTAREMLARNAKRRANAVEVAP